MPIQMPSATADPETLNDAGGELLAFASRYGALRRNPERILFELELLSPEQLEDYQRWNERYLLRKVDGRQQVRPMVLLRHVVARHLAHARKITAEQVAEMVSRIESRDTSLVSERPDLADGLSALPLASRIPFDREDPFRLLFLLDYHRYRTTVDTALRALAGALEQAFSESGFAASWTGFDASPSGSDRCWIALAPPGMRKSKGISLQTSFSPTGVDLSLQSGASVPADIKRAAGAAAPRTWARFDYASVLGAHREMLPFVLELDAETKQLREEKGASADEPNLSLGVRRALDFAAALPRPPGAPLDSSLLLAGALRSSQVGDRQDTTRIVLDHLAPPPPTPRDAAYDAVVRTVLGSVASGPLPTEPVTGWEFDALVAGEAAEVLNNAYLIAVGTQGPPGHDANPMVHSRHLVGALIERGSALTVQKRLRQVGVDLPKLRKHVYDFFVERLKTDDLAAWRLWLFEDESASPPPEPPTIASLASDAIGARITDADDRLGVAGEAEAFAKVLASTTVHPPLSLGLFGDWGTGKSFFMRLLEGKIQGLAAKAAKAKERGKPTTYCESVVQIWFNAWHYMDANLWASLVTHIFEELAKVLSPGKPDETDEEVRARLFGELAANQELLAEAEKRKAAAETERGMVEGRIRGLEQKRAGIEGQIAARRGRLAGSVAEAVLSDAAFRGELEPLAREAGIPPEELTYARLRHRAEGMRSLAGRLLAIPTALRGSGQPRLRFALIALFAVAPLLLAVGLWWLRSRTGAEEGAAALAAGVLALAGAVGPGLRLAGRLLRRLEEAQARVEARAAEERERLSTEEAALQTQLGRVRAAETAADDELHVVRQEVRRLTTEMEEIRAGRRLQRFLQDRIGSADYRQHLGIIALIRRDFDRLKHLIQAVAAERDAALARRAEPSAEAGDGPPPEPEAAPPTHVDRIILYIDDLDRCPEDRVVEVLQAVHLLLAFDLFIVVVGVDSRWLLRSVEGPYARVLAPGAARGDAPADGDAWRPTPQNYLEKIFQIPFSLRPMESGGFGGLIRSLVPVRPEEAEKPEAHEQKDGGHDPAAAAGAGDEEPKGEIEVEREGDGAEHADGEEAEDGAEEATAAAEAEEPADVEEHADGSLTPAELHVEAWERDFMEALHPLIPSPRAAKRFINVYRFLRAGLDGDALARFRGTRAEGGEHRAAALLLAIQTGYPTQAVELFRDLAPPDPAQASSPGFLTGQAATYAAAHQGRPEAREWTELRAALESLSETTAKMPMPEDVSLYQAWAPRVARYSFRSGRTSRRRQEAVPGEEPSRNGDGAEPA